MSASTHELLVILDNLEKSYTPTDPAYKFNYVFYNVVNTPFDRPPNFPLHLWNQALLPDRTLMPVILNQQQVQERRSMQNDLANKLNGAYAALQRKVDALKTRREEIREKLTAVCRQYREVARQHARGDPQEDIYKLQVDTVSREPYVIEHSYDELVNHLVKMKNVLKSLDKKIDETLSAGDKKLIGIYNLDRQ